MRVLAFGLVAALSSGTALVAAAARAGDVRVVTSGGFTAAYRDLAAGCEAKTGVRLTAELGSSMGGAPDSIPSRLARREPVDIVILARPALDRLVAEGRVAAGSETDLARSTIAVAIRSGLPRPDIATLDAFKAALRNAKSIAYSASASGTFLSEEALPRNGIWDEIRGKTKRILSERVGTVIARGDAELGFQQLSELVPIDGIDILGPVPPEVQQVTVFSAGIVQGAAAAEAARAVTACLSAPAAAPVISKSGLDPIPR